MFSATTFKTEVKTEVSLEITNSLTPLYGRLIDLLIKGYKIRTRFLDVSTQLRP